MTQHEYLNQTIKYLQSLLNGKQEQISFEKQAYDTKFMRRSYLNAARELQAIYGNNWFAVNDMRCLKVAYKNNITRIENMINSFRKRGIIELNRQGRNKTQIRFIVVI